jgi:6-phosphofructokinase 1
MRIAISTGGGDAPGLNAVIRAAALSAINRGWEVLGIKRGFAGLMGEDEVITLTKDSVRGIAHMGGTILRSTNRGNPFFYPRKQADGTYKEEDRSDELMENASRLGIDALISIGGDGSLDIARRLCSQGDANRLRAEDDRQRRERHGDDVRLRHGGEHGARGDR